MGAIKSFQRKQKTKKIKQNRPLPNGSDIELITKSGKTHVEETGEELSRHTLVKVMRNAPKLIYLVSKFSHFLKWYFFLSLNFSPLYLITILPTHYLFCTILKNKNKFTLLTIKLSHI